MGNALQNHIAALFDIHQLRYQTQKITEGKNKPDFLFPGHSEYHSATFPDARLAMLAAKSSCKDRWRQILTEAQRIPAKHLCTLEASISIDQTNEMQTHKVRLVIPAPTHSTYAPQQRSALMTLNDFVNYIRHLQTSS